MAASSPIKKKRKKAEKKKATAKFAQEAHEAIRPAIPSNGRILSPAEAEVQLPNAATQALYRLIYQRSVASRMPPLVTNRTSVVIEGTVMDPTKGDGTTPSLTIQFTATGSVVLQPGYTAAYSNDDDENDQQEEGDTDDDDDKNNKSSSKSSSSSSRRLPELKLGQILSLQSAQAVDHTTQPPPRYNEASFIKELEALGVGRPSTYAGIVKILRERAYVGNPANAQRSTKQSHRRSSRVNPVAARAAGGDDFVSARGPLVPSLTAFVVCDLLAKYCPTYVDPEFTARMEERLDQIASGTDESVSEEQRVAYLDEFYAGDQGLATQVKRMADTVRAEEARRARLPSLQVSNGTENSGDSGPSNQTLDDIALFVGPWGPYVQTLVMHEGLDNEKPITATLPSAMAADVSLITPQALRSLLTQKEDGGVIIGQHPADGRNIRFKMGRFGAYLQWGDDTDDNATTHSLPKKYSTLLATTGQLAEDREGESLALTLEEAVGYISLPRTVATVNNTPVVASMGPYGPYLKYNNSYLSLHSKDGDVLTIDAETAERLVLEGIINGKRGKGVLAVLGQKGGAEIVVKRGKFGDYVNWKKVNVKLPSEFRDDPSTLPLEEAWALIQEKVESDGPDKGSKSTKEAYLKLPQPPKRPLSAYLHFCAAKRSEVSARAKSLGEVSKQLAAMWADQTPEERAPFEAKHATEKTEYAEKKRLWTQECNILLSNTTKKGTSKSRQGLTGKTTKEETEKSKRKVDTPQRPKRPKSAYLFFCAEHRDEVSANTKSLAESSKELARLWAATVDRSKYESLATADKKRYQQEMQLSENGSNEHARGSAKTKLAK